MIKDFLELEKLLIKLKLLYTKEISKNTYK